MKSLKALLFVIGCAALCNTVFADQLDLMSNIVYGTAGDFKGGDQAKPLLKQVQVKINNGDWRDVPMTYRRAPLSLNNNDQYAIRVQAADGEWYHTQPLKYNAARDGSSKNLSINGILTPLNLVQDGIEVARFYNQDNYEGTLANCMSAFGTIQCHFSLNIPNNTGGFQAPGHFASTYMYLGTAYLDAATVRPGMRATGTVTPIEWKGMKITLRDSMSGVSTINLPSSPSSGASPSFDGVYLPYFR